MLNERVKAARWSIRLLEFEFDVDHPAGSIHEITGAMEILMTGGTDRTLQEHEVRAFRITADMSNTDPIERAPKVQEYYDELAMKMFNPYLSEL